MDELFSTFIDDYNTYASSIGLERISLFEIETKLKEKYDDRNNIYDKLERLYPTIKKFIADNMCKVYCGKQMCVKNDRLCHKCNRSFVMLCAVTWEDDKMIHISCVESKNNIVKEEMHELLRDNSLCKICNETCIGHVPIMADHFYHRTCCLNRARESFGHVVCPICIKPIVQRKNKIEYCTKDGKSYHIECAKNTHFSVQFKKTTIQMSFNRCGICGFYIMNDKYIHTICQNKLKQLTK